MKINNTRWNVIHVEAAILSPADMARVLEVGRALRLALIDELEVEQELASNHVVRHELVAL